MQFIYQFISYTPALQEMGLTFMRVGMGIIFIGHGYLKLVGGPSEWLWSGQQMANFGIVFLPVVWGFCAMLAELVGGTCLALGLGTRIAAFFLGCVMLVALVYHLKKGDNYSVFSTSLLFLIFFMGFMIAGGSKWSLDALISKSDFLGESSKNSTREI